MLTTRKQTHTIVALNTCRFRPRSFHAPTALYDFGQYVQPDRNDWWIDAGEPAGTEHREFFELRNDYALDPTFKNHAFVAVATVDYTTFSYQVTVFTFFSGILRDVKSVTRSALNAADGLTAQAEINTVINRFKVQLALSTCYNLVTQHIDTLTPANVFTGHVDPDAADDDETGE